MTDVDRAIAAAPLIIAEVAKCVALYRACEMYDIKEDAFFEARRRVREIARDYALARENSADRDADEMREIADNEDLDPQIARNRIDVRKWRASKHKASIYGDRIDLNVTQSISVTTALDDARARLLRPLTDCDVDAQFPINTESKQLHSAALAKVHDDVPDIFS